ncbi:MAG: MFS transporter, partial [Planctomycetaceae bacterium]
MAETAAGQSATGDRHQQQSDADGNRPQVDPRGVLLLLVLINAGALGLQGLLSPLTVELQRDLHTGKSAIAWMQTGFLIVYAAATPLWGLAAVHFSRRNLLIVASLLWGGCCACLACVETSTFFSGLFWIAAIGNAAIIPLTWSMAVDLVRPDRRGVTFGWLATGQTLGMGCAFLVGGLLVEEFGWQLPFLVFSCFGVSAAGLLFACLRREPAQGAMEEGLQELFESGQTYDYSVSWPDLKRLFSTGTNFWLSCSTFLCSVADGGLTLWFIPMLRQEHGFNAVDATWLTVGLFASQIPGAVILSGLSDRVQRRSENGKLILLAAMTACMAVCYFIGLSIPWEEASLHSVGFPGFLVLLVAGAFVTASLPPLLCGSV